MGEAAGTRRLTLTTTADVVAAALVAALQQHGYTVVRRAFLPDQAEDRRRAVLMAQDVAVDHLVALVAPRTTPAAVGTALAVALYPATDPGVPAPVTLQLKAAGTFVSLTAAMVVEMMDALDALVERVTLAAQATVGADRERRFVYMDGRWFAE